jgi:ArsR family transcriptional regulator
MRVKRLGFELPPFVRVTCGVLSGATVKLQALSDPTRLRILHLLRKREMCVCDLVDVLKIPQPTASRHLARLRKSTLVSVRRDGLWTYYSLAPAKTAFQKSLLKCLDHASEEFPGLKADEKRAAKALNDGSCVSC